MIEEIEEQGLVERSAENGVFLQILTDALGRHEIVGDVRDLGMIAGVELVTDRARKEPNHVGGREGGLPRLGAGADYLLRRYVGKRAGDHTAVDPLEIRAEQGVAILDQAIEDVLAGKVSDETVAQFAGW